MIINSNLFSRGHPLKAEAGLSDILENHKRQVLKSIREISDLDQMTDSFLQRLVKESIVEPLSVHIDKKTGKQRTEQLDGSSFPQNSQAGRMWGRGHDSFGSEALSKQVVRISVPFSGDHNLLAFAPNPCSLNLPRGEVNGKTIQFDVILWGADEDTKQRASKEITENCEMIASFSQKINEQVQKFNESLPSDVKVAFAAKLDELTKQRGILADLGIPDEPDEPLPPSTPLVAAPKKPKDKAVHIIQYVENQYVQQLNQTNHNEGDVNNAIQSNE